MSPKLPVVSGADVIRVLERIGFERARQKGSHIALIRRTEPIKAITVPKHKELARGTLRAIIRQADLSVPEFLEHLGQI